MAAPERFTFTASASLLHNNLACSPNGFLACVHNSVNVGACKLMFHVAANGSSRDGPEVSQATSIRFLDLSYGTVLCVGSTNGTQIYTEDGTNMLYFMPINDNTDATYVVKHHRGACIDPVMQSIVCGTSTGGLAAVQSPSVGVYNPFMEMPPSSAAEGIADLCYNPLGNNIVSAHHNGDVRFWVLAEGRYLDGGAFPGNPAPARVAALGAHLLVACVPGTVTLRDALTAVVKAEISAHARCLTAMLVREELCQVLTVGEDTILNVWQIEPTTGQVAIVNSQVVADKLLTGLSSHPAGGVAVTAYDSDEIFHLGV